MRSNQAALHPKRPDLTPTALRRQRRLALIGGLLLTTFVTGCGSAPAQDAGQSSEASQADSSGIGYGACMREHGVPKFPDPDAEGRIRLPVRKDANGRITGLIDPNSTAFQSAQQACQSQAPEGWGPRSAAQTQEEQAQALAFAQCMRQNGVRDYPDPQISNGRVQLSLPSSVNPDSPAFKAVLKACSDQYPVAFGG